MTVAISPSWSRKWRQTGLCQSYWRWLSQHETTTSGGPLPWMANAWRGPAGGRQKRNSLVRGGGGGGVGAGAGGAAQGGQGRGGVHPPGGTKTLIGSGAPGGTLPNP